MGGASRRFHDRQHERSIVASISDWASIVASSLDWEQARVTLDNAVKGLPTDLRGRRAQGFPHSVWELVDHIRRTQHDLLEFCTNAHYHEPKWPDDYWPNPAESPTDQAWTSAVETINTDAAALARFTIEHAATLTEKIPHGTGQTYLRTVLVAVDHASY